MVHLGQKSSTALVTTDKGPQQSSNKNQKGMMITGTNSTRIESYKTRSPVLFSDVMLNSNDYLFKYNDFYYLFLTKSSAI